MTRTNDRPEGVGMEDKTMSPEVKAIMDLGTEAGKQIPEFKAALEAACAHHFTDPESMIIEAMEQILLLARQADAAQIEKLEGDALNLRKRIHNSEKYNQFFERCESPWCNPRPTLSAIGLASEIDVTPQVGDRFAMNQIVAKDQQIAALEQRVEGLIAVLKPIAVECHKCLRNVAAGQPFQFGIGVIEIRNAMEAVYGPSKTDAALAARLRRPGRLTMESSADRVKAFLNQHTECCRDDELIDPVPNDLTFGDLRALHAQHVALWEVVRAADRAIFQWKKRVGPMSREDWRDFGSVQLAFSAARAKLAALSAEEKEKKS